MPISRLRPSARTWVRRWEALESGQLDAGRYFSYEKLQREIRHLALKQDGRAQRLEKAKWKTLSRMVKDRAAMKGGRR